jgi:hypothetical protein
MGLMDLFNQGDIREKIYAAANRNPVPQGGVTGAAFHALFPQGLGNLAFGRDPEPIPALNSPEGTQYMADLASNMMVPGTFIGPKGMSNLLGDDVARGLMSGAEAKLAQGVPREEVFRELGVFKGPEGKWRYEIDDSGAMYRGSKAAGSSYADEVMPHPELHAALPQLSSTRVKEAPGYSGIKGNYDEALGEITLYGDSKSSTMLHELQHAVQGVEDFGRGGSGSISEWASPTYRKELLKVAKEIADAPPPSYELFWGKDRTPEGEAAYAKFLKQFNSKQAQKDRWAAAQQGAPIRAYERLAGEAESRAVQDRMNMNMEQRRASFPEYATRNDLIIRGLMSGGKN